MSLDSVKRVVLNACMGDLCKSTYRERALNESTREKLQNLLRILINKHHLIDQLK